MNDCENCRHINFWGLPDWSTMPCAVCARYGADNDPTMWEAKPQTNYDRIISKSPEELAEWIAGDVLNLTGGSLKMATEAWLKWLKREATE